MHLNHAKIMPSMPTVHGKIVFQDTGAWCQKVWGALL